MVDRKLNAHDMYCLGLLTHIVEEEPQNSLMHALGHTVGQRDEVKAVQTSGVDTSALSEMLDTMHILDDELVEHPDGDIMKDPIWDKAFLVPPKSDYSVGEQTILPEFEQPTVAEIEHCFSAENVEECKQRLTVAASSGAHQWAMEALERMKQLPEKDLKVSFVL